MGWARLAAFTAVHPGSGKRICVGDRAIALFNAAGSLYAVDDDCPHAEGGRLSRGTLEGTTASCPLHGACFDLATGKALEPPEGEAMEPPVDRGVRVYPVKVLDGDIYVAL